MLFNRNVYLVVRFQPLKVVLNRRVSLLQIKTCIETPCPIFSGGYGNPPISKHPIYRPS